MNEFYWAAIVFAVFVVLRILQWFALKAGRASVPSDEHIVTFTSDLSSLALPDDSEGSALGATGIVPGGVSWTEPERRRATIELGNKRFGKGRNG